METLTKEERQLLEEKYGGTLSPAFEQDRERLSAGEPLAYVIGWQPFLGLSIYLDSRPLIPRPETEWWTEELITHLKTLPAPLSVLDLCAGSGAIGCAVLKHVPEADVWFAEIDEAHAKTIEKNLRENGLDATRAHIVIGDLFDTLNGQTFSVIATNPPYVPEGRELPESVTAHEPAKALFAGGDGLSLIRRIALKAPRHLSSSGELWLECDSSHVEAAAELIENGTSIPATIRPDLYGRPRLIVGYYP